MPVAYTDPVVAVFVVLPALLAVCLVWGTAVAWRRSGATPGTTRRVSAWVALGAAAWMAGTLGASVNGVLRNWGRVPPPFAMLLVGVAAIAAAIVFTRLGGRLAEYIPLWALVGVQFFRLPLELAMHALYGRGIVPEQMTYSGRNFDILTGATAILVAAIIATGLVGRWLVAVWNAVGLALLLNVVTVAILSTPMFRYFGDDHLNVWVTYPPFIWLPAVMVMAALAGHLIVFRALAMPSRAGQQSASVIGSHRDGGSGARAAKSPTR